MPAKAFLACCVALLLGACAAPVDTAGSATPTERPEAVERARSWLAARLDLRLDEVEVLASERREWSDSCLGLGGPAESCLAAMTPGWLVELEAAGRRYEVRTDETGQAIRSPQVAPEPPGPPGG